MDTPSIFSPWARARAEMKNSGVNARELPN